MYACMNALIILNQMCYGNIACLFYPIIHSNHLIKYSQLLNGLFIGMIVAYMYRKEEMYAVLLSLLVLLRRL